MVRPFRRRHARDGGHLEAPAPGPDAEPSSPAPLEPTDAAGLLLGGRYRLERVLGSGGEASVYAARDTILGRTVAVKLFHRQAAVPSQGALEQAEARVGAALNHYALTTLFDTGIDVGPDETPQLYLVMEYVPGETLRARLRRGPLEVSEACWLGFDLAEGLDYMHQTGFLHRDVKPSNILISALRSVRPVIAKLTDFGIAAPVGEPDLSEFTVGTAAYLSPEQVEGHDARPESDVYSLGLVLLEAMTGRAEFRGSVTEAAFARLTRDPQIPQSVPARAAVLLRRMTARRPEDRIGLHDAAVELQQILVDDLTERRGGASATAPAAGVPRVGPGGSSETHDAILRLAAGATAAPKALLLGDDAAGGGSRIAAAFGWSHGPVELATDVLRQAGMPMDRLWAIGDTHADPRLAEHPVVRDPHRVRSIAAAPVLSTDRRRVGTLLVCDERARSFTEEQQQALIAAASVVAHEMQLQAAVRHALFPDAGEA